MSLALTAFDGTAAPHRWSFVVPNPQPTFEVTRRRPTANTSVMAPYKAAVVALSLEGSRLNSLEALTNNWLADTQWLSSHSAIARHPNFASIVAMGGPAIDFILDRLRKGDVRMHWFIALVQLVGTNVIAPSSRGKIQLMAADWLGWAAANGR